MKRIIEIKRQRRNKNRYTIYFDDDEWIGLFDELVIKHGLVVGKEVDSHKLMKLSQEDDARKARNLATRYLGYRSRSHKEMVTYLEGKGFNQDIINETIERLEGYGYMDDGAFARDWVNSRMAGNPRGKAMIKMELFNKGIDADIVEEALARVSDEDEEEQAYKLALKYSRRYRDLSSREKWNKLGQALARRGFSWEIIRRANHRLNIEEEDE
ncbi:MAG TPA: RecX family transcriptional regulator [Clostridia bacterium]|nr:RecX family transcriptional regulator [Clostridia bacterium]